MRAVLEPRPDAEVLGDDEARAAEELLCQREEAVDVVLAQAGLSEGALGRLRMQVELRTPGTDAVVRLGSPDDRDLRAQAQSLSTPQRCSTRYPSVLA